MSHVVLHDQLYKIDNGIHCVSGTQHVILLIYDISVETLCHHYLQFDIPFKDGQLCNLLYGHHPTSVYAKSQPQTNVPIAGGFTVYPHKQSPFRVVHTGMYN